jgi:hypothetical protein
MTKAVRPPITQRRVAPPPLRAEADAATVRDALVRAEIMRPGGELAGAGLAGEDADLLDAIARFADWEDRVELACRRPRHAPERKALFHQRGEFSKLFARIARTPPRTKAGLHAKLSLALDHAEACTRGCDSEDWLFLPMVALQDALAALAEHRWAA